MDTQKAAFLTGEGDGYFRRNAAENERCHRAALANVRFDPVLRLIADARPARILEVGAADGWRLDVARQLWGAQGTGIEPSREAVAAGKFKFPLIDMQVGTADALPPGSFDCVIFGFCLYLCDRSDLFRIAAEADRVLADGGYLVVHDFFPPSRYSNAYAHRKGVFSFKMDYSALWSWHPHYVPWRHEVHTDSADPAADPCNPNDRLAVTVLRKIIEK